MKLFRLGFSASTTLLFLILLSASQTVSAQLIISEFRVRGPAGANDEFIELYNNSGADHTVAGGGTGYAVAASNGVARCVIPNGTVIPNRGHYLCVNSVGYSLAPRPQATLRTPLTFRITPASRSSTHLWPGTSRWPTGLMLSALPRRPIPFTKKELAIRR